MSKLFGVPVGSLAAVLAILLAIALGIVAAMALRNRVFFRLGVRNLGRRRGRTALIVTGLMLGTAIIAAALATGDTMSTTIRSSAIAALGQTDEVVAAKGVGAALAVQGNAGGATDARYFPTAYTDRIAHAVAGSNLVDGIEPVIFEQVALQDLSSRQTEPQATLFATDPTRTQGFGQISSNGETLSLATLRPGEVYLNTKAADELSAHAGDTLRIFVGQRVAIVTVKAVASYQGGATDSYGLMMPLAQAQRLLRKPGLVRAVFVSNRGGSESGAPLTRQVVRRMTPVISPLGLEADKTKQDALKTADTMGATFMSVFTTFGSFSVAAGILLIFLIFVMLAAERRGELGIARAVGTRRRHLVQMFVYEGVAYDLVAAAVGALLGIAVAYGMVLILASAFVTEGDFHIAYSVRPTSIVVAYAIGVLLTLLVVGFSASRVSRMNIVTAIRNLPQPPAEKAKRRRWLLGLVGVLVGGALAASGAGSKDAIVLGLGVSILILSLVPIAKALGTSERAVYTTAGLALVLWFVLPISRWLLGDLKVNFSIFILAGIMIVVGATWVLMYNADLLLKGVGTTLGRIPALAGVARIAIAYPLRGLFRTGVTVAMFTLVVFTLVTGAITTGSFVNAANNLKQFGGGFDIRASVSPASPISNMPKALAHTRGINRADFRVVSGQSLLPVKARQTNMTTTVKEESAVVHGVDAAFLTHTTYGFGAIATGYTSDQAVWQAVRQHPGLAVIDALSVPHRANWNFGPLPPFHLRGLYVEDKTFTPIPVTIRDPQTGRSEQLKVIGVLSDSAPQMMTGVWTSQTTLSRTFGDRVLPTGFLFRLAPGVDATATAKQLESAFLANGMKADSLKKLLNDAVSASLTFDWLIEGFMGLGLVVGVAALGVITARAVVERRQQIGVLRAIGFRKTTVELAFLLESSFVAVTSIVLGTGLGLIVAHNVISDASRTPSWHNISFDVPWLPLAVIFLAVYLIAMLTTLAPARRAARIYPAEALRYQ
jgi:putative ABC transport system permease protein